ncbi:Sodium/glutamate symporter [invertebrate metagenome]|uniref:Sodium/glutamate symporter n=1 Tax=invertebrate metagenome TaxID=1711999 RepID=A0A2H9T3M3_9ZZZZ
MVIMLSGINLLLMAIAVLYIGRFISRHIVFLKKYHIPSSVTGGLLCSLLLAMITYFSSMEFKFDLHLRDLLLLGFFSTIGLSARIKLLMSGGKTLTLLMLVTLAFLLIQNTVGVTTAMWLNEHPVFGLLAGTITFAGGHGTAITWGNIFEQQGYIGANEFGVAAATLGLILGGLVGGPVARNLISRHQQTSLSDSNHISEPEIDLQARNMTLNGHHLIAALFLISFCIAGGNLIQQGFHSWGLTLPDFVPVLFTGIIVTNIYDWKKVEIQQVEVDTLGDICLQLFIVMSLMSMQFNHLTHIASTLLWITAVQVIVIILFARYVVYTAAGKNYDASIITAGFIGMGLGATPVGMANMSTLTHRYGPSPKAFLIVPLLGSFFVDISNAFILQGFLQLPFFK